MKIMDFVYGSLLGLTLAAAPISGCGPEENKFDTVGGLYPTHFEVVSDKDDVVLPENESGDVEFVVVPLNKQESWVALDLFEWHDFERNKGRIYDQWQDKLKLSEFTVEGTIGQGNLSIDACLEFVYFGTTDKHTVCWEMEGFKQTEYEAETSELEQALSTDWTFEDGVKRLKELYKDKVVKKEDLVK